MNVGQGEHSRIKVLRRILINMLSTTSYDRRSRELGGPKRDHCSPATIRAAHPSRSSEHLCCSVPCRLILVIELNDPPVFIVPVYSPLLGYRSSMPESLLNPASSLDRTAEATGHRSMAFALLTRRYGLPRLETFVLINAKHRPQGEGGPASLPSDSVESGMIGPTLYPAPMRDGSVAAIDTRQAAAVALPTVRCP
jgi:hypothetical protein